MSDYLTTPNLGLFKPTYNADVGQWGGHLNHNADVLDGAFPHGTTGTFLPLSGGSMSGTITGGALTQNPGSGNAVYAYPVGNSYPTAGWTPTNAVVSQLVSQSQANNANNPEWTAVFGTWATGGQATGAQKVAVYAAAVQSPGSGPVWSLNTLVTRNATQGANNTPGGPGNIGSGTPGTPGAIPLGMTTVGYELDWNNYDQDLPVGVGFGVGMWIQMHGSYPATAAIYMSNTNSATLLNYGWHDGILFTGQYLIQDNTILDSTHAVNSYTDQGTHSNASHYLNDTSPTAIIISGNHAGADISVFDNAPNVLRVQGTHTHVIDPTGATISDVAYNGQFSATGIQNTPIGGTTAAAGTFTNLSSTGAVSGAGFSNYLASPPAIGGTTPANATFVSVTAGQFTGPLTTGVGSVGKVGTTAGDATHPGHFDIYDAASVRVGYVGFSSATNLIDLAGNGGTYTGWNVIGTMQVSGLLTLQAATGVAVGQPTIRSGTGAATGTQPSGSLWLRIDGTAGNRIYVSQGAGTWVAVASV